MSLSNEEQMVPPCRKVVCAMMYDKSIADIKALIYNCSPSEILEYKYGLADHSLLYVAVSRDRADVAAILLHYVFDLIDMPCRSNFTPLHIACSNGLLDNVQLLINAGANVNFASTRSGETPLHIACRLGFVRIVTELIDAGASIDMKDNKGITPIDAAINFGFFDVVDVLLTRCGPGAATKSAVRQQ
jgi:ankyrin repeat protein